MMVSLMVYLRSTLLSVVIIGLSVDCTTVIDNTSNHANAEPKQLSSQHASQVGAYWDSKVNTTASNVKMSWWENKIILDEVNRRVSGNVAVSFAEYFKKEIVAKHRKGKPFKNAMSVGSGGGMLERQFIQLHICLNLTGYDLSPKRVAVANLNTPAKYRDKLHFTVKNLEEFAPDQKFDLIILKMAFHHIERLEFFVDYFYKVLEPGGVIYFDEYVGPARFQFSDLDIAVANRYETISLYSLNVKCNTDCCSHFQSHWLEDRITNLK